MFRRGKMSFLNTKDDRTTIINARINLAEKHFLDMASSFAVVTRKMAKYRDSYDELAKCFKSYADDEDVNESLGEGLKNITNAATIMGDYMDLNVHRMEMRVSTYRIVNELAQFETMCKTTRDNLRTAVIARDKEVLKQRQMLDMKTKFSANNSAANSELMKAKVELNRANKQIDSIINGFESKKLADIKTILTDFILISMKYHSKVLEALTASYYDVSNIDPKGDMVDFQKLMKTKAELPKQKKQGLRSQSMENLDKATTLSPLKRKQKIWRSNKNLSSRSDTSHEEDDLEDDDDEDEDESDDNQSNSDEDDSGTASDDEDKKDDDDGTETDSTSDAKPVSVDKKKKQTQPFKAVASTHVAKHALSQPRKPFAVKRRAGRSSHQRSDNAPSKLPIRVVTTGVAASRLVTFVESKKPLSAPEHASDAANRKRGTTKTNAFGPVGGDDGDGGGIRRKPAK